MSAGIEAFRKTLVESAPEIKNTSLAEVLSNAKKLPREYGLGSNMKLTHYFEKGNVRHYLVQINASGTAPIFVKRENNRVFVDLSRIPPVVGKTAISSLIGGLGIAKDCRSGRVEFRVSHGERFAVPVHFRPKGASNKISKTSVPGRRKLR
jgi:hypothetical protein